MNWNAPNPMIARLKQLSGPPDAVIAKGRETEGKLQMLSSPRKIGLTSLFKEGPPVLLGIPWPALRGPLRNHFWKKKRPQPYWGGDSSGNALEASNAFNYRVWGIPTVLLRGIPGNALRAFPGSFRNFSGISSGKSQPYWGYVPLFKEGSGFARDVQKIIWCWALLWGWGRERNWALSFFSLVLSKTPRKTSKTPRIFLALRTLENLENKHSRKPRNFAARKAPKKQKRQGKEGQRRGDCFVGGSVSVVGWMIPCSHPQAWN